ncbi:MAG: CapA family protein [Bacteroidales bacterium]|nr:CapA family protein [Bacteroidales bacterium]
MKRISIFFAGDFCSKPSTSHITVSDELKGLIKSCDLKVVNFEVPLKPDGLFPQQKYERFWQNDDSPVFLRNLGFNLFTMANNHVFDWGDEGYKKTKRVLGEQSFGSGMYDEAYKVKVCEVNGAKIGFMALSYAAYTGVFNDVLNRDGLGCAFINDLRVNHDIMNAKKVVDFLFVLPHDGIEYIDVPLPETIARYRDFIDFGADGVIGTHPHCPQGWEEYKGKPIFYSLGNFFFNSKESPQYHANKPHWYEGMCVKVELDPGGIFYNVINTQNTDNVLLTIDHRHVRAEQNEKLVLYLKDKEEYAHYLKEKCQQLTESMEMPIIDKTFHINTLKQCAKLLFKNWARHIRGKKFEDDLSLMVLLKNDTRNNLLKRGIKGKM